MKPQPAAPARVAGHPADVGLTPRCSRCAGIIRTAINRVAAVAITLGALAAADGGAAGLPDKLVDLLSRASGPQTNFDAAPLYSVEALLREAAPAQQQAIEKDLLKWLDPAAPPRAREYACRILWRIGTAQSAPALQRLLTNSDTVDLACYAIAGNPCPELGQALRDALPCSTGHAAVSILDLLGQRRDAKAIPLILPFLKEQPAELPAAAIQALGKIGSAPAVAALAEFSRTSVPDRRTDAEHAWLRAVETLDPPAAIATWKQTIVDTNRDSSLRRAALLRLSEQSPDEALPWLLAVLQDQEPQLKPASGNVLRNSCNTPAAQLVIGKLDSFTPATQVVVVEALGETLPIGALTRLARSSDVTVKLAALQQLGTKGGPQAAMVLVEEAASASDPARRSEILALLKDTPGPEASQAIQETLASAPAQIFADLARVLVARNVHVPASAVLAHAKTGDIAARIQAIRVLGFVGTAGDYPALLDLLKTTDDPDAHQAVETVIAQVLTRARKTSEQTAWLTRDFQSAQRAMDRQSLLRLLAQSGTPAALETVLATFRSGRGEERETALQVLCDWPNAAAIEPLLALAEASDDDSQRVQALHGIVPMLADSPLEAVDKSNHFRRLVKLARDAADRKMVLSGLAQLNDPAAFEMILPWIDDPAAQTEAALAAISVARQLPATQAALVNTAMNKVADSVADDSLRKRARDLIRSTVSQPGPTPSTHE